MTITRTYVQVVYGRLSPGAIAAENQCPECRGSGRRGGRECGYCAGGGRCARAGVTYAYPHPLTAQDVLNVGDVVETPATSTHPPREATVVRLGIGAGAASDVADLVRVIEFSEVIT